MSNIVAKVIALNSYARKGTYINESWGSTDFKKTYAAAVAACKDGIDSTTGVTIDWSALRPKTLGIVRRGIINERMEFHRELPLDGDVGAALLLDLQVLAVKEAAVRIKVERELALLQEAGERVAALLLAAPPESIEA